MARPRVTLDLCNLRAAGGSPTIYSAENVEIHDFDRDRPFIRFIHNGEAIEIACDLIAGCDGYHGVCRASIPKSAITTYGRSIHLAGLACWLIRRRFQPR